MRERKRKREKEEERRCIKWRLVGRLHTIPQPPPRFLLSGSIHRPVSLWILPGFLPIPFYLPPSLPPSSPTPFLSSLPSLPSLRLFLMPIHRYPIDIRLPDPLEMLRGSLNRGSGPFHRSCSLDILTGSVFIRFSLCFPFPSFFEKYFSQFVWGFWHRCDESCC